MNYIDKLVTLESQNCREVLRRAARSDNTRIAYEKGWRRFVSWCESVNLDPIETCADDVIEFLVGMASTGRIADGKPLALNTLRLYRSALNYQWHKVGLNSPASDRSVDEVLRGLAKLQGDTPRRVKALREYQILAMLDSCGSNLHGLRDTAVLSLGFAAALRRSELCNLRVEDLERKGVERMVVYVRHSKTDLQGVGQSVAVIEGNFVTPIKHLGNWLRASGICKGFVFQTLLRGGIVTGRPIDSGEVARIVKRYAQKIGLDPREYSGHSLRAGFVTSAAVHNARIDKIMEVTRHRNTEMVLKYIRDEDSFDDHAGSSFL